MKRLVTSRRLIVRQVFFTVSIFILLTALAQGQNLFEADDRNIYKFTPDGTRSTFASGLDEIFSLACDNEGNLFVSSSISYNNNNLYKFTPDGTKSTFASGFHIVKGMAFNSAGNLFATDSRGIIYKFTPSGASSIFASRLLFSPEGLACDSADNLFVLSGGPGPFGEIYKFTPDGTRSTFASGLDNPGGLACDSKGNLFVSSISTSSLQGNIYKYKPDGTCDTFASLPSPFGLACDSADNLFVADTISGRILKFTPGGTRSIFASGLNYPHFLVCQPIPEPATLLLLGLGAVILRKRKK